MSEVAADVGRGPVVLDQPPAQPRRVARGEHGGQDDVGR